MPHRSIPPADRCAVEPTAAQISATAELPSDQPIVMLNLLRFRQDADYSASSDLAPAEPISGADAYAIYGAAAMPHLEAAGASVVVQGGTAATVIGPPGEHWDAVVLVRYPNIGAFLTMVQNPEYIALAGHRTAALLDSRLIPSLT